MQNRYTILAIDPGFVATGVAVMEITHATNIAKNFVANAQGSWVPIHMECIRTEGNTKKTAVRVADDDVRRCQQTARRLSHIIEDYDIRMAVIELPHGGAKGARPIRCMALVSGVLAAVVELYRVAVEWYTPSETRIAATGKKSPTKQEVIAAMSKKHNVTWSLPLQDQEHIADALATFEAARLGNLVRQ